MLLQGFFFWMIRLASAGSRVLTALPLQPTTLHKRLEVLVLSEQWEEATPINVKKR